MRELEIIIPERDFSRRLFADKTGTNKGLLESGSCPSFGLLTGPAGKSYPGNALPLASGLLQQNEIY